jgi:hypothetical protein
MITAKLGAEPTSSPVDLQPPPSIQNTMSPKPSTIQRIQSFFRHTPRKICLSFRLNSTYSFCISSLSFKSYYKSIKNHVSRYALWSTISNTR